MNPRAIQVRCSACEASIPLPVGQSHTECAYCGATYTAPVAAASPDTANPVDRNSARIAAELTLARLDKERERAQLEMDGAKAALDTRKTRQMAMVAILTIGLGVFARGVAAVTETPSKGGPGLGVLISYGILLASVVAAGPLALLAGRQVTNASAEAKRVVTAEQRLNLATRNLARARVEARAK